jgi:hypothetical protein
MSRSDWEKSPNDRKEEAFHASDETKARAKSKKLDKPFVVQSRWREIKNPMFASMLEWYGYKKFASLDLAQKYVDKLKREAWSERKEFRIIDLREGTKQ